MLQAEDKSDWVFSSCGRKIRTLHQLYSFVSSALFIIFWKREEWKWREIQAPGSSAAFQRQSLCPIEFHRVEKINAEIHDSVADKELAVDHQDGRQKE